MFNTQALSKVVKVFFIALILITIFFQILMWQAAPNGFNEFGFFEAWFSGGIFSHYEVMYEMSLGKKILGFGITMLYECFNLAIYWMLYKLFDLFSKREYFSLKVVNFIKKAGLFYLIKTVFYPFYEILLSFFTTMDNPEGHRMISVSFSLNNLADILLGLILFVTASIMYEGVKLKNESNLTV